MCILDNQLLDDLSQQADNPSRIRRHFDIYSYYEEIYQRLFNSIYATSYILHHRHSIADKKEPLVAMRGFFY